MSRIGKMPIPVESGLKVSVDGRTVSVQGPKGSLSHDLPFGIRAELEDGVLSVQRRDDSKSQRALHGTVRALLANAVHGVSKGFSKELEIHGVGYRAELTGKAIKFSLGYTHPIEFQIPEGIQIALDRGPAGPNTKISVSGFDRQKVGQMAADIRALRPPDPYKLKGVRYTGEVLRKKAGKTAAT